jgi:hypothetical protein
MAGVRDEIGHWLEPRQAIQTTRLMAPRPQNAAKRCKTLQNAKKMNQHEST